MAKPVGSSYTTYYNLENEYPSFKNTLFSKIYEKLSNSCTDKDYYDFHDVNDICNQYEIKDIENGYVIDLLKKLNHNFKKIYLTANNYENAYFIETPKDVKEYCIYFKYWLYDEILSKQDCKSNTEQIYKEWEKLTNDGNYSTLRNRCTFNKLGLDDIEKLKSVYAFTLIFYNNINIFNDETNIPYKYLYDLGKGLKAYSESISRCSIKNNRDTYCIEFKEFLDTYKLDNLHLKTSESYDYQFTEGNEIESPLVIESLKEPLGIMYKEGKSRWHLSDKPIYFLNTSIISASSAIGTAVGISSFLLYLYKFTDIRSLFGRGKPKDGTSLHNEREETHDFTLDNSEP